MIAKSWNLYSCTLKTLQQCLALVELMRFTVYRQLDHADLQFIIALLFFPTLQITPETPFGFKNGLGLRESQFNL
jgi:hypothetical protein